MITIAIAFLGYVLPWGQISFWGATVITRLFSAIPFIGEDIVKILWGGFAVDRPTLSRFFRFHFFLPFIIIGIAARHLAFLHQRGSNNPLGLSRSHEKVRFFPYFTIKDFIGVAVFLLLFFIIIVWYP